MNNTIKQKYEAVNYPYDYQPPEYLINNIDLIIDIYDEYTQITATLKVQKQTTTNAELKLTGKNLELISVAIDSKLIDDYELKNENLLIATNKDSFTLTISNKIYPQANTYLEGIYLSNNIICSQCEAKGFSRITYFLDQPDVMSIYSCKIIADKKKFPILLSNGNLIEQATLENNRHFAYWEDPHKKPCYLFAVVAGDLANLTAKHTTASGKEVTLKIFTEHHNKDKCHHALACLKKSMLWDEQTYKLEYDLDLFMIVAIDHFNMGAMENKGLNIFNSACVLASTETATDDHFENILAVVGHEYFHNWSGNRVTCRDWYQLSLKEGFTVFREQQFAAASSSFDIKRIEDVERLLNIQFPEDSGPLSHSVQPRSYAVDDFYTATIYEKGAELIHMLWLILGADNFYRGCNIYFTEFDGKAATCEDFICCLERGSSIDLQQFRLWYFQSGTPRIQVRENYSAIEKKYQLTIEQLPPKNNKQNWQPMHIPLAIGFIDQQGNDFTSQYFATDFPILHLTEQQQTFDFDNLLEKPEISLLRDYSAPVILINDYSQQQLIFTIKNDTNMVNKWLAWNKLTISLITKQINDPQASITLENSLVVFKQILQNEDINLAVKSKLSQLPAISQLEEQLTVIDPIKTYDTLDNYKKYLADNCQDILLKIYQQFTEKQQNKQYTTDYLAIAERRLKNICLSYLTKTTDATMNEIAYKQYNTATNMTDRIAALNCLLQATIFDQHMATEILDDFYKRFADDANVISQWFAVQMRSPHLGTKNNLQNMLANTVFDKTNPNHWRAVVHSFINNTKQLHNHDDLAYDYLAELIIKLDKINPQIAAKTAGKLANYNKMQPAIKDAMQDAINSIYHASGLSKDCKEVIVKLLADT